MPDCRVELVQLLMTANDKARAEIAAKDAEEVMPPEVAPLAMGYIYDALGDYAEAAKSYEKAVKQRPDLPVAVRMLAECCLRNGDMATRCR